MWSLAWMYFKCNIYEIKLIFQNLLEMYVFYVCSKHYIFAFFFFFFFFAFVCNLFILFQLN